jgi:hypothetical protein
VTTHVGEHHDARREAKGRRNVVDEDDHSEEAHRHDEDDHRRQHERPSRLRRSPGFADAPRHAARELGPDEETEQHDRPTLNPFEAQGRGVDVEKSGRHDGAGDLQPGDRTSRIELAVKQLSARKSSCPSAEIRRRPPHTWGGLLKNVLRD